MALADRLTAPPARRSSPCAVGRILNDLPTEDSKALAEALHDERWTTAAIHNALRAEGYQLARSTVVLHRKGGCACPSSTP